MKERRCHCHDEVTHQSTCVNKKEDYPGWAWPNQEFSQEGPGLAVSAGLEGAGGP